MRGIIHLIRDRLFIKKPQFRRAVTRFLERDLDKQVDLSGTTLTINTIKEHGYLRASRICAASSVFRDELSIIINLAFLLDYRDTFIDIGANVGLYTHTIARFTRLFPGLQVYAFEANPDTYARLVKTDIGIIKAEQVALSDHSGEKIFIEGAVSHVFTTLDNQSSYNIPGEERRIKCRRLDDIDIEGGSIVMKIDVEGQELEVLLGATKLLEAGRIKAIYFDGYKDRRIEEILRAQGFIFLDGRTFEPAQGEVFSLLAINPQKYEGLSEGIR